MQNVVLLQVLLEVHVFMACPYEVATRVLLLVILLLHND